MKYIQLSALSLFALTFQANALLMEFTFNKTKMTSVCLDRGGKALIHTSSTNAIAENQKFGMSAYLSNDLCDLIKNYQLEDFEEVRIGVLDKEYHVIGIKVKYSLINHKVSSQDAFTNIVENHVVPFEGALKWDINQKFKERFKSAE